MKRLLGRKLAVGLAVIASVMGVTTPAAVAEPTSGAGTNVVGGTPATHPWTVSLQSGTLDKPKHECGGTLIAPRWVMTAAHCEPYVHGRARIGSLDWKQGGELIEVKDVITHPDYPEPSGSFGNNIALVELKEPAHSEPIRLGTMGGNGQVNTVAGWGTTCDRDVTDPDCRGQVPDKLQQTDLRRAPGTECTLYNSAGVNLFYEPTMACFVAADGGKNGPCFGDSGSPYMQRFGTEWVAVGIQEAIMSSTTPYPYACSQGPNGTIDHFGATTVEPFRQWIVDTILATDPKGADYIQSNWVTVG